MHKEHDQVVIIKGKLLEVKGGWGREWPQVEGGGTLHPGLKPGCPKPWKILSGSGSGRMTLVSAWPQNRQERGVRQMAGEPLYSYEATWLARWVFYSRTTAYWLGLRASMYDQITQLLEQFSKVLLSSTSHRWGHGCLGGRERPKPTSTVKLAKMGGGTQLFSLFYMVHWRDH